MTAFIFIWSKIPNENRPKQNNKAVRPTVKLEIHTLRQKGFVPNIAS